MDTQRKISSDYYIDDPLETSDQAGKRKISSDYYTPDATVQPLVHPPVMYSDPGAKARESLNGSGSSVPGGFDLLRTAARVPENIVSSAIGAYKGQEGVSVVNKNWGDKFIDWVDKRNQSFQGEFNKKYGWVGEEVASLPQNLGFSGVSMAAGLAAGVPLALAPDPTLLTKVAAYGAGMTAGGATGYRMDAAQVTRMFLNKEHEKSIDNWRLRFNWY